MSCIKLEEKTMMSMEMSDIKLEEKRNMKDKHETIVKKETNALIASTVSCIALGSKVKLTELPLTKDQQKLGMHQFAT
jgi:PIN domain nuclease of toxin-antitoxin system